MCASCSQACWHKLARSDSRFLVWRRGLCQNGTVPTSTKNAVVLEGYPWGNLSREWLYSSWKKRVALDVLVMFLWLDLRMVNLCIFATLSSRTSWFEMKSASCSYNMCMIGPSKGGMCIFNTLVNHKFASWFGRVASCSYCNPLVSSCLAMHKDRRVIITVFKFETTKRVPFVFNTSSHLSTKRVLELITLIL